jgi:membrane protein YqaA with SNARE-associated domain
MSHDLWALFGSAFISSTLLPGGSEVLLAYLGTEPGHDALILLLVASAGNTLGGMTSWGLGWWIRYRFPLRRMEKSEHRKALERIQRWGSPVLLLSWLPVIGDPLCLVAGWLRMHWAKALVFIAIGKAARYAVILYWVR